MADRDRTSVSRNSSRAWLAAGALALGAGAMLAAASGTAHADAGASASDGARSAGAAARSSARDSPQRVRGSSAATGAVSPRNSAANQGASPAAASVADSRQTSRRIPAAPTVAPCLQSQTCGQAIFGFTGAPQSWTVPAGVQSVLVQMQGAFGASSEPFAGQPAFLGANLQLTGGSLPAPTISLSIDVGSAGQASSGKTGGSGGYGGGGSGGSGSEGGSGGGGGGGATTVATVTGDPSTGAIVLVAGGGGGDGGYENGPGGFGGVAGGVPTNGPPTPEGVWPGNAGNPGMSDDNPGAGGAGGTQSSGIGTSGGDAETLSGNGGGGGGGGGWQGGSGGDPGQASASLLSPSGSGGGGGGGSSYANPTYTTWAIAGCPAFAFPDNHGAVFLNWVDILTPALTPLRVGRAADQQLVAATSLFQPGNPVVPTLTWSVSAGALPAGLTLSKSGKLSGKPIKAGPYSFVATVQAVTDNVALVYGGKMDITSVITYSGTVCSVLCGGDWIGHRFADVIGRIRAFLSILLPLRA